MSDDELAQTMAASMDAPSELLPLLPALFEGIEELGARCDDVLGVLSELPTSTWQSERSVLDLGCGKGAVAIGIARAHGARVLGVDGVEAFVDHAAQRARASGVHDRCRFERGDVRDAVARQRGHDLVSMLALGDLLGDDVETLDALRRCVVSGGHVLVDGAHVGADADADLRQSYPTRAEAIEALQHFGDEVVAERVVDDADTAAHYRALTEALAARAETLAIDHPHLAAHLRRFASRQRDAVEELAGPVIGCLWLIRRS